MRFEIGKKSILLRYNEDTLPDRKRVVAIDKSFFRKLLLSYLPIFLIVTAMLLIIVIAGFAVLTKKASDKAGEVMAQYASKSVDHLLYTVDQAMLREVLGNEIISGYYLSAASPELPYKDYVVSEELRRLQLNYPQIDTIYLYRTSDQALLTHYSKVTLSQSDDREWIQQLLNSPLSMTWTGPYYSVVGDKDDLGSSRLAWIRKMPISLGNKGVLITTVKVKTILELTSGIIDAGDNNISIYDSFGNALYTSNHADGDEHLKRSRSAYTGWDMSVGVKNEYIFGLISGPFYLWIIASLLTIAAGIASIVYISRRNYRPIEAIVQGIRRYSSNSKLLAGKTVGNEFNFIETAFDDLLQQSQVYQEHAEENRLFKRQRSFQMAMEGTRTLSHDEWRELLNSDSFAAEGPHLIVACAEIDEFANFCFKYPYRDQSLLKFVLNHMLKELANSLGAQFMAEWMDEHRLGVLCIYAEANTSAEAAQAAAILMNKAVEWVADNLDFTITIGVGEPVGHLEELPQAYAEAVDALSYKTVLGLGKVIHRNQYPASSRQDTYKHLQAIRELAQSFRLGEEQWREQLSRMFGAFRSDCLQDGDIKAMLNYFIYHLYREVSLLSKELQAVWQEEAMHRLDDAVGKSESLDELERVFDEILEQTAARFRSIRSTRTSHAQIQQIRLYIDENYANPELSLVHLGEEYDLNAKYVSRLFKEEIGVNFLDYVTQIRIEHAKKLLVESQQSVQSIGEKVGYMNPLSFIRTFKKLTGETPGDYRKP